MSLQVPIASRSKWTISLQIGSEFSADSPHGRDDLHLRLDGELRYENHAEGKELHRSAQVAPEMLEAWIRAVQDSGFPKVPDPQVAPGANLVSLTVSGPNGSNTIRFSKLKSKDWPGYGFLLRTALSWNDHLRADISDEITPPEGLSEVRA
jgi:hypothetical protein